MITQADRYDAEEILALQKLAYQSEARLYNDRAIPPLTQTLDEIREQFGTHIFLKETENSAIIGSVRAYEKDGTCYIGRLIVHPDYRKRGIGTRLMHAIENRLRSRGRFELFTGTKSTGNIRFYQNLGYRIIRHEKISEELEFVYLEKKTGTS